MYNFSNAKTTRSFIKWSVLILILILESVSGLEPVSRAAPPEPQETPEVSESPGAQGQYQIFLPMIGKRGQEQIPTPTPTATPGPITSDYYVDAVSGSDSNSGVSRQQAWRTIQKAANTMTAGKTCTILTGNYPERVQISRSGSAGAPVTYQAQGTVTMKGYTVRASYINIVGFDITDITHDWVDGWGIYVRGSDCRIENNYIHYCTHGGILIDHAAYNPSQTVRCSIVNNRFYRNSQSGIEIRGQNHLVENNEIWGTIQYHPQWTNPPTWVDADGMRFFGSGHIIRDNYIHDITYSDPLNYGEPHIDCIQTWNEPGLGAAQNCVIEQNTCWLGVEKATKFLQLEGGAKNLIVRNNVSRGFIGALLENNCTDNQIVNNVLVSDPSKEGNGYIQAFGLSNSPRNTFKNNIIYDFPHAYINADSASRSGLDAGFNCVYRSDGQTPAGSPYPNDLWGVNPNFVSINSLNFQLHDNSPAIDAGVNLTYVAQDFIDTPRPQQAGYDIGAYEWTTLLAARIQ